MFGDRIEQDEWVKPGSGNGVTTVTRFAYDGSNAWADLNSGNALTMRRLYLDGVDQPFARVDANNVAAWYLTDHLGSVRDVMDKAGATDLDQVVYDAYGNITSESSTTNGDRYKYTGREWDPNTGLQFNRARYYDSKIGRWLAEDPLGFTAGDANLYRYANNQSTGLVDPTGTVEDPRLFLVWTRPGVNNILNQTPTGQQTLRLLQNPKLVQVFKCKEIYVRWRHVIYVPGFLFYAFPWHKIDVLGYTDTRARKPAKVYVASYVKENETSVPIPVDNGLAALTIVHELTHTGQEWPSTGVDRRIITILENELAAYQVEARFLLELVKLKIVNEQFALKSIVIGDTNCIVMQGGELVFKDFLLTAAYRRFLEQIFTPQTIAGVAGVQFDLDANGFIKAFMVDPVLTTDWKVGANNP